MSGIGTQGELWVIEYLQKKKNMEIYLPLKDKGIDFIGTKNNDFYQIQVKTSMFQKNSYFWFDLHKSKMRYHNNTYYIFVCATLARRRFMGKKENYIVIPSREIEKWVQNNDIATKQGNSDVMNIFIYPDVEKKEWYYRNKGKTLDLTIYWNNFDFIK